MSFPLGKAGGSVDAVEARAVSPPALVGVVVLVVAFVLTPLSLARDLSGALCDHLGVRDLV